MCGWSVYMQQWREIYSIDYHQTCIKHSLSTRPFIDIYMHSEFRIEWLGLLVMPQAKHSHKGGEAVGREKCHITIPSKRTTVCASSVYDLFGNSIRKFL